jgi:hypothetical protein
MRARCAAPHRAAFAQRPHVQPVQQLVAVRALNLALQRARRNAQCAGRGKCVVSRVEARACSSISAHSSHAPQAQRTVIMTASACVTCRAGGTAEDAGRRREP